MSDKAIALMEMGLQALIVLVVGYIIIKILLHFVKKAVTRTSLDASLHKFIQNSVKVVLWIILLVTVLGVLNIPTSTFIAVLGACGAAIALALKDSLGNIAGGIIVLVTHPFKRGDYISINGVEGKVESIDLLVTTLKTIDNKVISVPNGTISTSVLVNFSSEDKRRVDCKFGIGYNDDIAKAKEILYNVSKVCENILPEPEPVIGVSNLGESCVEIDIMVWCRTEHYWEVKYFMTENVKIAFDEADISIPYPQMDVHVGK